MCYLMQPVVAVAIIVAVAVAAVVVAVVGNFYFVAVLKTS